MDEKEIIIDTSFGGYTFVGAQYGRFKPQGETKERAYYNMFVISPFVSGGNNITVGVKAEKLRCLSDDVWKRLKPGDKLLINFDCFGRVQSVNLFEEPRDLSF